MFLREVERVASTAASVRSNGDSNVAFFKEYKNLGRTAAAMPVPSVSIAELLVACRDAEERVGYDLVKTAAFAVNNRAAIMGEGWPAKIEN